MLIQKNLHVFILYKWVSETCVGGPCATTSDSQLLQMARPSGVQRCKFTRRFKKTKQPNLFFLSWKVNWNVLNNCSFFSYLVRAIILKIKGCQIWLFSPTVGQLQLLLPSLPWRRPLSSVILWPGTASSWQSPSGSTSRGCTLWSHRPTSPWSLPRWTLNHTQGLFTFSATVMPVWRHLMRLED